MVAQVLFKNHARNRGDCRQSRLNSNCRSDRGDIEFTFHNFSFFALELWFLLFSFFISTVQETFAFVGGSFFVLQTDPQETHTLTKHKAVERKGRKNPGFAL